MQNAKCKSYNSQIPSSKLNNSKHNKCLNKKKFKAKDNVSNNSTNTLNHEDRSFSYFGWVSQSTVDHYKQHYCHC